MRVLVCKGDGMPAWMMFLQGIVSWILVVHVFGIVLWVGGLLMTTVLLSQHARETAPEALAALTRLEKKSMRAMADPGALLAILAGITMIVSNPSYYAHALWLHYKLSLVAVLIILHAFIGVEMKSRQKGSRTMTPGRAWLLFGGVLLVFIAILVATLPGEVYLR
jgi:putative membrane protein